MDSSRARDGSASGSRTLRTVVGPPANGGASLAAKARVSLLARSAASGQAAVCRLGAYDPVSPAACARGIRQRAFGPGRFGLWSRSELRSGRFCPERDEHLGFV